MASELGGKVEASEHREFGYAEISPGESGLFGGFSDADSGKPMLKVWMSHGDRVEAVPPGFEVSAKSPNSPIAAMEDRERHSTACNFTRRSRTRCTAMRSCGASSARSAAAPATGRPAISLPTRSRTCGAGRRWPGAAGLVGRRRLIGRCRAASRGDRRSTHLRFRRSRIVAA